MMRVADDAAMRALGARLGLGLADPARQRTLVVLLHGPLGAGKTTLVRGLLEGLGHRGRVPSPTYTLAETYALPGGPRITHLDLYRLADPDELEFIGWRDWLVEPGLLLVEWPDRVPMLEGRADLVVRIEVDGDHRHVAISDPAGTLGACGPAS